MASATTYQRGDRLVVLLAAARLLFGRGGEAEDPTIALEHQLRVLRRLVQLSQRGVRSLHARLGRELAEALALQHFDIRGTFAHGDAHVVVALCAQDCEAGGVAFQLEAPHLIATEKSGGGALEILDARKGTVVEQDAGAEHLACWAEDGVKLLDGRLGHVDLIK